ncbi:MAG: TetR/AcrR family transcriptional regulator [Actinomycetota bacterium]
MKAARTRHRIERVALELFERDGYDNVSTRQVAEAAGVTERTFFRHFATKLEPLMGNPDQRIQYFTDLLRQQPVDLDPLGAVLATIAHEEAEYPPTPEDLVRRRIVAATPSLHPKIQAFERSIEQAFVEWLAERVGRSVDDFEVTVAASILVVTRRNVIAAWAGSEGSETLLSLSQRALAMLDLHLDPPDVGETDGWAADEGGASG